MPLQQKIFAISISIILFIVIIDLVRRKKLREEFSWLWLLTGGVIILLAAWYDVLLFLTNLVGAVLPTSTLFLFGLLFLMIISLYYSTKISTLHEQMKDIAQQVAILQAELHVSPQEDEKLPSISGRG